MSLTYGFYDSLNGDRVYNAEQFGSIFDGVIVDGVYMNIGDKFKVTPNSGMTVNVGTGRAWFKHTWTLNTTAMPITLDAANAYNPRIDLIAIRVDKRPAYRQNSIVVLTGTPASTPTAPSYSNANNVYEYPIARIYVNAGATEITASNITSMVGNTGRCPYVTSPTGVVDISSLTDRFQSAWDEFYAAETEADHLEFATWMIYRKNEYLTWFEGLVDVLDGDAATVASQLEAQITALETAVESNEFVMSLIDDEGNFIVSDYYEDVEEGGETIRIYPEEIAGMFSYAMAGDQTALNGLFTSRTFTYTDTVYPGNIIAITRQAFGAGSYDGTPVGYTPLSFASIRPGNTWLVPVANNVQAGNNDNMLVLRNTYSQSINFTAAVTIVFVKSHAFG